MLSEEAILRTVTGITFLIFMAKVFASIGHRFKIPEVVGEVLAGVIFGPYALGSMIKLFGEPMIQINEITNAFALIGGIVVLFAAGLEFTFADFLNAGLPSFTVGTMGVLAPFLMVIGIYSLLQRPFSSGLLVGAAMSATSIAITVRTLEEMNQLHSEEAKIIVNAAIIDDVLAIATLTVVISILSGGAFSGLDVVWKTASALGLWFVMLIASVYLLPLFIDLPVLVKATGAVEAASVAICFGLAFISAMIGLSPIVGAFAAGMAIAGSKGILRVREYADKFKIIFGPLFFAITGSYLNLMDVLKIDYIVFILLFNIALISKIVGCGLPAARFLKNVDRGLRVGIGMISRGEVGFIVAGLALSSGYIMSDTYAALISIFMLTTVLTPFLLLRAFTAPIITKRDLKKMIDTRPN
jgi:Kef-type K+ transport system membrane component KefB